MIENNPKTIGALFDDASDYLETRVDLLKMKMIDKASDAASSVVSVIATLVFAIFALILLSIALAVWLGDLIGTMYLGFLIVGGLYVLIAFLFHFFRKAWIKDPIACSLIKKMLN